ncbi:hypothetical protein [Tychonema sp. LEGE 07203]|uniref:hypothetical protein n=1 Tax=Tychonema sp. LEGE 07203 TaxID=1828671 RepID=UPI0018818E1B|nr:hypothetical protein [Tychonema sp. LEGE 07203]MBE9094764.1 hypothetical protein [Tychonema sp. LEGE 07203]
MVVKADRRPCVQQNYNTATGQQQKTCAFCVGDCKNPVFDADAKKYRLTRKQQQTAKKNRLVAGSNSQLTPKISIDWVFSSNFWV